MVNFGNKTAVGNEKHPHLVYIYIYHDSRSDGNKNKWLECITIVYRDEKPIFSYDKVAH